MKASSFIRRVGHHRRHRRPYTKHDRGCQIQITKKRIKRAKASSTDVQTTAACESNFFPCSPSSPLLLPSTHRFGPYLSRSASLASVRVYTRPADCDCVCVRRPELCFDAAEWASPSLSPLSPSLSFSLLLSLLSLPRESAHRSFSSLRLRLSYVLPSDSASTVNTQY